MSSVQSQVDENKVPFQTEFAQDFPTIDQLRFDTVSRSEIKGEDLLGQVVLIVFFEPQCSGCVKKLSSFEQLRKSFESEGVTFIGMSSSGGGIAEVARDFNYNWIWATNSVSLRTKIQAHRAFESFLFDRTGTIAYRFSVDDKDWKLHVGIGMGSLLRKPLDMSDFPQAFVGSQACGFCHPAEFDQWSKTAHAQSHQTLVISNHANQKGCNGCHVTGEKGRKRWPWQSTPKSLQEVGCEECHGPGGPHRSKPFPQANLYSSKEESCKRCHDPGLAGCAASWEEPKWDYASALSAVTHGMPDPIPAIK